MRNSHTRQVDTDKQMQWLERKHQELKKRVAELEDWHYLSPEEQRQRAELKKRKLATKDALEAHRRQPTL